MKTFDYNLTYHRTVRCTFNAEVFANSPQEADEIGRHLFEKTVGVPSLPNIRIDRAETRLLEDWDGDDKVKYDK